VDKRKSTDNIFVESRRIRAISSYGHQNLNGFIQIEPSGFCTHTGIAFQTNNQYLKNNLSPLDKKDTGCPIPYVFKHSYSQEH